MIRFALFYLEAAVYYANTLHVNKG